MNVILTMVVEDLHLPGLPLNEANKLYKKIKIVKVINLKIII